MMDAAVRSQERFCDAGEFVVECFTADGKTYPHVGSQAVGERIVRCRDCRFAHETCDGMFDCEGPMVQTWDYYNDQPMSNPVQPDGFCAWGIEKED